MFLVSAAFAGVFALIHVFIGRLTFLDALPRSRWLSFAGGIAVGYVFLHVLPELSAHQQAFADAAGRVIAAEKTLYLVAFFGLVLFYGLELAARRARRTSQARPESAMLWLHVIAFAVYNVLIGYLLVHREARGLGALVAYAVAMALHFVVNDHGLREERKAPYDAFARWVLAASVLLGWGLGATIALPPAVIGLMFAFLAGGIVLNVLKEELPAERRGRFWPFALGSACYALLLIPF